MQVDLEEGQKPKCYQNKEKYIWTHSVRRLFSISTSNFAINNYNPGI